jgi:CCR4-NOT transcription complex subunit 4
MEAFDLDDLNFFPCTCTYQVCRFCWNRIRNEENGLCPACRQLYPENPVNFQPLSSAEIQKIKIEKKQRIQQQKNKVSESRRHLSSYRVLQKNLVYIIGLSQRMADAELLKKHEFFGKFGKILKVAIGTPPSNVSIARQNSFTAYVTYGRTEDALRAIQSVDNLVVDGRVIKASLGTTKYCSNFLKGLSCTKQECMYLHEIADGELSFTRDDMHQGKHTEYERKLHQTIIPTRQSAINGRSTMTNGKKIARERKESESPSSPIPDMDKPPPGFPEIKRMPSNGVGIHVDNIIPSNPIAQIAALPTETSGSPSTQVSSSSQFFMDLYDDIGFDPFSESARALADMLEEEERI